MIQDLEAIRMCKQLQSILDPAPQEIKTAAVSQINELVNYLVNKFGDAESKRIQHLQQVMMLRGILVTVQEAVSVMEDHPNTSQG